MPASSFRMTTPEVFTKESLTFEFLSRSGSTASKSNLEPIGNGWRIRKKAPAAEILLVRPSVHFRSLLLDFKETRAFSSRPNLFMDLFSCMVTDAGASLDFLRSFDFDHNEIIKSYWKQSSEGSICCAFFRADWGRSVGLGASED